MSAAADILLGSGYEDEARAGGAPPGAWARAEGAPPAGPPPRATGQASLRTRAPGAAAGEMREYPLLMKRSKAQGAPPRSLAELMGSLRVGIDPRPTRVRLRSGSPGLAKRGGRNPPLPKATLHAAAAAPGAGAAPALVEDDTDDTVEIKSVSDPDSSLEEQSTMLDGLSDVLEASEATAPEGAEDAVFAASQLAAASASPLTPAAPAAPGGAPTPGPAGAARPLPERRAPAPAGPKVGPPADYMAQLLAAAPAGIPEALWTEAVVEVELLRAVGLRRGGKARAPREVGAAAPAAAAPALARAGGRRAPKPRGPALKPRGPAPGRRRSDPVRRYQQLERERKHHARVQKQRRVRAEEEKQQGRATRALRRAPRREGAWRPNGYGTWAPDEL